MNFCTRHGDRDALSFCHSCGKFFCRECLTEGIEYYYCKNDECQKQYKIETGTVTDINENEISKHVDKKFVQLNIYMNQSDGALFKSLLDDAGVEYFTSGGSFFEGPVIFNINVEQTADVEKILENFQVNISYYSTNHFITE